MTPLLLAAGCVGMIGDEAPEPAPPGVSPACAAAAPDVEAGRVRMLNKREYGNTVRDLLGVTTAVLDDFPADAIVGFDNRAESLVASSLLVEAQLDAAEDLAGQADLAALSPCSPADACVDEFIASFGRRAYRRPLSPEEAAALRGIFERAEAAGRSADAAARLVIEGALLSPQFLYRVETSLTPEGGVVPVAGFELASRLSYFLWASMPDDALLTAAETGALDTPEGLEAEARRLLADPRARAMTEVFHDLWLELYKLEGTSKDPELYPGFAALAPLFAEETRAFTDRVFWEEGAAAYLVSDSGFMNDALAAHYGVSGPTGSALERVDLAGSERVGLLTQGSILATSSNPDRTSPTRRGKFVRMQLLCQPPPPPPADVPPLAPSSGSASDGPLRERLAEHVSNPTCAGCHRMIDPVGFGLESFDTIGAYRTEDAGAPIDASGELIGVDPGAGAFVGARELSERLAQSDELYACIARQWFRFATGREEGARDTCTLERAEAELRAADDSLPELLVALVRSNAFVFKRTESAP